MNGETFLREINDIDEDLLTEAMDSSGSSTILRPRQTLWQWASMAACLTMLLTGSLLFLMRNHSHAAVTAAFAFQGTTYEVLSSGGYSQQNLPDAIGDAVSDSARIRRSDLGPQLGTAEVQIEEKTESCPIYRFAPLPEDDRFCVVEYPSQEYWLCIAKEDQP